MMVKDNLKASFVHRVKTTNPTKDQPTKHLLALEKPYYLSPCP